MTPLICFYSHRLELIRRFCKEIWERGDEGRQYEPWNNRPDQRERNKGTKSSANGMEVIKEFVPPGRKSGFLSMQWEGQQSVLSTVCVLHFVLSQIRFFYIWICSFSRYHNRYFVC